jgi:hypothetical protein
VTAADRPGVRVTFRVANIPGRISKRRPLGDWQRVCAERDGHDSRGEGFRAGVRYRCLARGCGRSGFSADAGAGEGVGSDARAHRGRIVGVTAHRLFEAPGCGRVSQYEGGWAASGPGSVLARERGAIGWGGAGVSADAGQAYRFDPPFPCHSIMHGSNRFGLAGLTNLGQTACEGSGVTPPLNDC